MESNKHYAISAAASDTVITSECQPLPNELWLMILNNLSQKELRNTSQVSKTLHVLSEPMLYAELDGTQSYKDHRQDDENSRRIGNYIRTLIFRPELAGYLKKFTIGRPVTTGGWHRKTRVDSGISNISHEQLLEEGSISHLSYEDRLWFVISTKDVCLWGPLNLEQPTLTIPYAVATAILVHIISKTLKSLGFVHFENPAGDFDMEQILERPLLSLTSLCVHEPWDHTSQYCLYPHLENPSLQEFIGVSLCLSPRVPPSLDDLSPKRRTLYPSTVELIDCCFPADFLRSMRELKVSKWNGEHGEHDEQLFTFLNEMNTCPWEGFRKNLEELVIGKKPHFSDDMIDLNLDGYHNLKKVTIPCRLAFGNLDDVPGADNNLLKTIAGRVVVFMRKLPRCLQYLAITECQSQISKSLQDLVVQKGLDHSALDEVVFTFRRDQWCTYQPVLNVVGDDVLAGSHDYTQLNSRLGNKCTVKNLAPADYGSFPKWNDREGRRHTSDGYYDNATAEEERN